METTLTYGQTTLHNVRIQMVTDMGTTPRGPTPMHSLTMVRNGQTVMVMAGATIQAATMPMRSQMSTHNNRIRMETVMVTTQMVSTRTIVQTVHLEQLLTQQDAPIQNSMTTTMAS